MTGERLSIELRGEFQDDRRTRWTWEITFEKATTYAGWGYYGEVWSDTAKFDIERGGLEGERTPAQLQGEGEQIARNRL